MTLELSKRFGIFVAACLALATLAVPAWSGAKEPAYDGQPLSHWFQRLPLTFRDGASIPKGFTNGANCGPAIVAVQNMGTNALPFLFEKLEQRESAQEKRSSSYLRCQERAQAVTGLLALSPLPPEAVERLRSLVTDFKNPVWFDADFVLVANENDAELAKERLKVYK